MVSTSADGSPLPVSAEEKMAQFQQMMNLIIGRALEVNNEKLSQDISCLVKQRLAGEIGTSSSGVRPEGRGTFSSPG